MDEDGRVVLTVSGVRRSSASREEVGTMAHHGTLHAQTSRRRGGKRAPALGAVAAVAVLLLSACAAGPNPALDTGPDPAGFWLGLWQGFILPVTFVVSLFTDDVSVYEVANSGNWYDFGYVLGVVTVLGGGGGGGARAARR